MLTRRNRQYVPEPKPVQPGANRAVAPDELLERRRRLEREFAELQFDLGGLAYEMAIRDHFRVDLLVRQAARLQEVDAQLGAVERLTRIDQGGAAGACPNCDALYARGAMFCSNCAHPLMRRSEGAPPNAPFRVERCPVGHPLDPGASRRGEERGGPRRGPRGGCGAAPAGHATQ